MDFERLTERERQCLRLIGRAMSHKEVARELDLSDATVKEYLANARRKLGASTTREAARALMLAEAAREPLQNRGAPERRDAALAGAPSPRVHASGADPIRGTLSAPPDVADVAAAPAHGGAEPHGAQGHRGASHQAAAAGGLPAPGHDLPRADRPVLDRAQRAGGARREAGAPAADWGGSNDLGLLRKLGWAVLIMIVSLMAYGGFTQGLRNLAAALPLSR